MDSTGHDADYRAQQAGYTGSVGGEILGAGCVTAADEIAGWLGSAPHKVIMLDCGYRDVGVGYGYNPQDRLNFQYYWTAVFASP